MNAMSKMMGKQGSSTKAKLAVLDEIISLCDKAAADPFRKKEAQDPEAIMAIVEEKGEEPEMEEGKPSLEDMDMEELLAAYEAKKAKEEEA